MKTKTELNKNGRRKNAAWVRRIPEVVGGSIPQSKVIDFPLKGACFSQEIWLL